MFPHCNDLDMKTSMLQKKDNEQWHGPLFWYPTTLRAIGPEHQGAVSIRKTVLPGMATPMLKIRRPNGRLIFNMEIAIRR